MIYYHKTLLVSISHHHNHINDSPTLYSNCINELTSSSLYLGLVAWFLVKLQTNN